MRKPLPGTLVRNHKTGVTYKITLVFHEDVRMRAIGVDSGETMEHLFNLSWDLGGFLWVKTVPQYKLTSEGWVRI